MQCIENNTKTETKGRKSRCKETGKEGRASARNEKGGMSGEMDRDERNMDNLGNSVSLN